MSSSYKYDNQSHEPTKKYNITKTNQSTTILCTYFMGCILFSYQYPEMVISPIMNTDILNNSR